MGRGDGCFIFRSKLPPNHRPHAASARRASPNIVDVSYIYVERGEGDAVRDLHRRRCRRRPGFGPDPVLGWIAARTERIILSTATTLITTNDPVKIAEDYAMLQHLADGRVDLVMGRGNTGPVYPWFGPTSARASTSRSRTTRCCGGCGARTWSTGRAGSAPRCSRSRPPRARLTASRRSSGTAPSARPRSPSRPRTTATASSPTTSSGPRSTTRSWSASTARATPTTATAAPSRPSSASAARSSCAATRRTRSASSAPTSITPRSWAAGLRSSST